MKILSADWVIPITSPPIEKGAVVFEETRILEVGNSDELKNKFPNAEYEDFGAALIIPGFVNCHSHLELSIMRGFLDDVEEEFFKWLLKIAVTRDQKLTNSDIEISALLGTLEGVKAGVTCFGDIGRYGKAGFEALKKTGLRGVVFQETEFSPHNEKSSEDFSKLKEKFLSLKSEESDLVKVGISPHSPYTVSRKLFELITDYSLGNEIKLSIHAAESLIEEELMRFDKGAMAEFYRERGIMWKAPKLSSIEYLAEIGVLKAKPLLAHCNRTNLTDWELIKENSASIAHCPKSNAKFGHQVAPLEDFIENGLKVGFGSDSVASNNTCDILEEARFATFAARSRENKKRLLNPQEIVEMMTLGGAKAMQLEHEIGSLEVGKQADLAVLSLKNIAQQPVHEIYSALLFASSSRDIQLIMVAGKEVYRNGKSLTIDEDELKSEIKQIARKMQFS